MKVSVSSKKRLSIYAQNVGGLRTKLDQLKQSIGNGCYDIMLFVETWLTSDFGDNEVASEFYNVYRRDGQSTTLMRGGDVMIVSNKELQTKCLNINDVSIEKIYIQLVCGRLKYILGSVYIPPNSNSEVYIKHCETVEQLYLSYPDHVFVIFGDYNLPNGGWSTCSDRPVINNSRCLN